MRRRGGGFFFFIQVHDPYRITARRASRLIADLTVGVATDC
jgi:hypothetical protein